MVDFTLKMMDFLSLTTSPKILKQGELTKEIPFALLFHRNGNRVSAQVRFYTKTDRFCTENDGFCTESNRFCTENDGFWRTDWPRRKLLRRRYTIKWWILCTKMMIIQTDYQKWWLSTKRDWMFWSNWWNCLLKMIDFTQVVPPRCWRQRWRCVFRVLIFVCFVLFSYCFCA